MAPGIAPFSTYLYMSGTTFFTLGLGDVTPLGAPGRALVVLEAGMGFGFLAAIISYLPAILYQSIFRPRGEHFTPRCASRLAADGRGAIAAAR